jgi:hypothetical protein
MYLRLYEEEAVEEDFEVLISCRANTEEHPLQVFNANSMAQLSCKRQSDFFGFAEV